ncbi:PspC domain-containing protein [Melissococcus plutonius]|uniref:Phage shock protein PspC N-terminal domain-containing protein n=1 Tax=Melissococcus plutonius TaxID=33970 RepID=A0A2Z5Y313_9ENTE|nr:PspC domain-containing protein [Melissococcus plutonius]BAL62244.1 hypothetical protein MPD5_1014 [Melissococcus plutonius DAT561]MCV2498014.1 PspC domain-containing protein [Melissococcus plutonius]MCV2501437.1 PspC domain-containing protein [Melissococcus plutonius]MCV2505354.1 PspC domain-containing protein [Melissococcus plutonius]MCV2506629.1 PspC domain-containing protein [Melissococcus plutonius]
MKKKLTKSSNNIVLTGTLAGIAEWIGIDPFILRVIYVIISFLFVGFSIILYILLAILIPKKSYMNRDQHTYYGQNYSTNKRQRKQAEKIDEKDGGDC